MAFKFTKGSGSNKYMNTIVLNDDDSNPDEKVWHYSPKSSKDSFLKKKPSSSGVGRERSSTKGSISVNIDKESDNETKKLNKIHVKKIKFFECGKLSHTAANYLSQ